MEVENKSKASSSDASDKINIAIFGSGSGTNAEQICKYFKKHLTVSAALIVSNKANAGILRKASLLDIPSKVVSKEQLKDREYITTILKKYRIDFIVLAGFLLKIPSFLVEEYPNRIINIHPALLPKYGGKGMYGMNVHQAVCNSGDRESGITIHYVNEEYDKGNIIFQKTIVVDPSDNAEDVANKVQVEEHKWYPKIIEALLNNAPVS